MIGFIRGTMIGTYPAGKKNKLVIIWPHETLESFGVGYTIVVSQLTAAQYTINSPITLWVYPVQTDKESYLIGIDNPEKMAMFTSLLGVSGVGPRTALGIVDTISPDELKKCIVSKDVATIAKIPGIGQKTASKIVLELAGELDFEKLEAQKTAKKSSNSQFKTIEKALKKLGYNEADVTYLLEAAASELAEVMLQTPDIAEHLKVVFKYAQVR